MFHYQCLSINCWSKTVQVNCQTVFLINFLAESENSKYFSFFSKIIIIIFFWGGGKIFEQREAFVEIGFNAFVVNQQEIEDSILTSNLNKLCKENLWDSNLNKLCKENLWDFSKKMGNNNTMKKSKTRWRRWIKLEDFQLVLNNEWCLFAKRMAISSLFWKLQLNSWLQTSAPAVIIPSCRSTGHTKSN